MVISELNTIACTTAVSNPSITNIDGKTYADIDDITTPRTNPAYIFPKRRNGNDTNFAISPTISNKPTKNSINPVNPFETLSLKPINTSLNLKNLPR